MDNFQEDHGHFRRSNRPRKEQGQESLGGNAKPESCHTQLNLRTSSWGYSRSSEMMEQEEGVVQKETALEEAPFCQIQKSL